jgi:AcrR family transcriptional regulator
VRAIAARAGVSAALVIHHFSTKEGLRAACDEFVVEGFLGRKGQLVAERAANTIATWLADIDQYRPLIDAGVMREPLDREVTAAYVTLCGVATLVMQRQLARALGGDQLTAGMIRRSTLPVLDLYTHGLYTDDRLLAAAREALARTDETHGKEHGR